MTINLELNVKLEEITWKDDNLWYLTKPMLDSDIPETHTFQQKSEFGIFERAVVIIESKTDKEVISEFKEWTKREHMTWNEYLVYKKHWYTIDDITS